MSNYLQLQEFLFLLAFQDPQSVPSYIDIWITIEKSRLRIEEILFLQKIDYEVDTILILITTSYSLGLLLIFVTFLESYLSYF